MKKLLSLGISNEEREGIQAVEARLQAVMVEVRPRPEYVQELKRRMLKDSELEIAEPKPPLLQKTLLAAAGVLSGAVLLALGVRGIIALLNSLGVLQQIKTAIQPKKAAPANPVV